MKILLINPPQTFFSRSLALTEQLPLGILYIAAVLKKAGIDVEVLDALREGDHLSISSDRGQYGLPWDALSDRIQAIRPDLVGISNPYSSQIENAIAVANIAKRIDPAVITVMGGAHPTVAGLELMQEEANVDLCVLGEGEYVLRDLILDHYVAGRKDIKDIPGVLYRDGDTILSSGEPHLIDPLDDLPYPDYEALDIGRYLNETYKLRPTWPATTRLVEMVTSRGCPYDCVFCSVKCVMGRKFRAHSADYVFRHLAHLVNSYGVEHVRFNDDNISFNRKRFELLLDKIIESKLPISWDCPNGLRVDTLDEGVLRKMRAAGCKHIYIAVESGNQDIVNRVIGKKLDIAYAEKMLGLCMTTGIPADVYFILGLPGETLDTMRQTKDLGLKFLREYNANPLFFTATPLPGTRLLKLCHERGYLSASADKKNLSIATQGEPIIQTEEFTTEDVKSMVSLARAECAAIVKSRTSSTS